MQQKFSLYLRERIAHRLRFGEDAADEQEVIEGIKSGVDFSGAKLWILVIAVFVASLGLNTNSAAVIIGAMLISPLMGPIIGMGLGAGIYDFKLLKRSWRNYIIATLFSVTTATIYFLITPLAEAQSELLARTSPTIYDVLIALCGGLAGIIALSSKSQRTGNVIPGVAIATALMPPLCTVGFGIATANWTYAAGALFLFVINTIFIAFATLAGAVFIMRFEKKTFIDRNRERRVKRIIYTLLLMTIIPAAILTYGMVRQSYFELSVNKFIQQELHFEHTQVVSHHTDFKNRYFSVVLIGCEVDSVTLNEVRDRLPQHGLKDVEMRVVQGTSNFNTEEFYNLIQANTMEMQQEKLIITQQNMHASELEHELQRYTATSDKAAEVLPEMQILYPQVQSLNMALGTQTSADSTQEQTIALVALKGTLKKDESERLTQWLMQRSGIEKLHVIFEQAQN